MKLKNFSIYDFKYHFKKNRAIYFMLLFCFFIGVVLGIVVIFSSDNYIKLLTSDNRILYAYINGSAETAVLFWKKLIMLTPERVLSC